LVGRRGADSSPDGWELVPHEWPVNSAQADCWAPGRGADSSPDDLELSLDDSPAEQALDDCSAVLLVAGSSRYDSGSSRDGLLVEWGQAGCSVLPMPDDRCGQEAPPGDSVPHDSGLFPGDCLVGLARADSLQPDARSLPDDFQVWAKVDLVAPRSPDGRWLESPVFLRELPLPSDAPRRYLQDEDSELHFWLRAVQDELPAPVAV